MAVLAGILGLFLAAPAAHAQVGPIPFDIDVPIGGVGPATVDVVPDADTGLVGVCDSELSCTGFRATGEASAISGGTTSGQVTLSGVICVMDSSPECGDGRPFTGVIIYERVVDTPEPYVGTIHTRVNVCVWVQSPMDDPHACDLPVLESSEMQAPDSGNLADDLPAFDPGFWLDV